MRGLALLALTLLLGSACRTTPAELPPLPEERALAPSARGPLAELDRDRRQRLGSQSGFLLLDRNEDALRWRIALADSAVRSLDLQYYLWYPDSSGALLSAAVLRAADRGVRVRLLVDDLLYFGRDRKIAALDGHPHVDVRLYNPWREREAAGGRLVEFLSQRGRLNSRMHNKLMIADGRVAICGGRNIGDHYFGLGKDYNFHDLDLLGVGPVAGKLSQAFDVFWNSGVVAAGENLGEEDPALLAQLRTEQVLELSNDPQLERFPRSGSDWSEALGALPAKLHGGSAEPAYDRPGEPGETDQGSVRQQREAVLQAREELLFENAYWVPRESSFENIRELWTDRGIRVVVVTNSLASHDVPAVNSEYKKWRRAALESGVELYEIRHDAAVKAKQDTPPVESEFLGLHVKAFVVDREIVYVGSHNLDPRSRDINTELGVLVRSPGLARELAALIEQDMRGENSWSVQLDEDGDLVWQSSDARVTRQPARNTWQRIMDGFMGILPLEDQL
ncbi:MAG: phospholipase D family protein [Myxococcota bacterium]|nr:phospholipase D family protein [Myxococcota bacterium]